MTEGKIPDGPWEIEQVPIESHGGSNTMWRIGPMSACIYDDWRQYERAQLSSEDIKVIAHALRAVPELLEAASLVQGELLDIVDDWEPGLWNAPEVNDLLRRLRRLIDIPTDALDKAKEMT